MLSAGATAARRVWEHNRFEHIAIANRRSIHLAKRMRPSTGILLAGHAEFWIRWKSARPLLEIIMAEYTESAAEGFDTWSRYDLVALD